MAELGSEPMPFLVPTAMLAPTLPGWRETGKSEELHAGPLIGP